MMMTMTMTMMMMMMMMMMMPMTMMMMTTDEMSNSKQGKTMQYAQCSMSFRDAFRYQSLSTSIRNAYREYDSQLSHFTSKHGKQRNMENMQVVIRRSAYKHFDVIKLM